MALHFTGEVEQTEFQLIEPGTYAVVMNAEFKKTKGGDDFINCSFKIMKEFDNTWGGRIVFDGIYKSKTTGAFNEAKINAILSTIPNAKKDFEDYDELVQYINGIEMEIDIDIQDADASVPNSKDRNTVGYLSYKPLTKKASEPAKANGTVNKDQVVQNDDLPW
jgi:hypothetical protein